MAAMLPLLAAILLVAWQFVLVGDTLTDTDPPSLAEPLDLGRVRAEADLGAAR